MFGNSRFKAAARAQTPAFASATGRQGQMEQDAKRQENSQLSNNLIGAATLYNEGMGDNTPIADYLSTFAGDGEAKTADIANALRNSMVASGTDFVDPSVLEALAEEELLAQQAQNVLSY